MGRASDLVLEDLHRQRTRIQHLGMEFADVELRTERGLRFPPQPLDDECADLVRGRLARNGDVALDLGGRVGFRHARVRQHVGDRLRWDERRILSSRIFIGSAPESSTWAWNSRMSNFGPSAACDSRRSRWMMSAPTLYAVAWLGMAM